MKKLFLFLLFVPLFTFGQITINQEIVEQAPYTIGDTLTIRTSINTTSPIVFFTFDTEITNSALQWVGSEPIATNTNLTYTEDHYNNYKWSQNPTIGVGDLDGQYEDWKNGPKDDGEAQYMSNSSSNIHRYAFLTAGETLNGALVEEKFILLNDTQSTPYRYIHKFTVANAKDANEVTYDIGSQILFLSIDETDVSTGNPLRQVKLIPPTNPGPGYDPTSYTVYIAEVIEKDTINYTWSSSPIATDITLDANGSFYTDKLENGKEYEIWTNINAQAPFLDQVVTVSDVYLAFKNVMGKGVNNEEWNWDYGIQEIMADVYYGGQSETNQNGPVIDEFDVYTMFAHILGEPLDYEKVAIAGGNFVPTWNNIMAQYGLLSTSPFPPFFTPTAENANEVLEFGSAIWGDVDFSHSTTPTAPGSELKFNFSAPAKGRAMESKIVTDIDVATTLQDGKVIMDFNLTKEDLAGMQFNLKYDTSKLTFDSAEFDTGNEMFNFATPKQDKIIIGSLDRKGTARIKTGTPYRLIFTPKQTLQNTSGLVTFELTDAVNGNAKRVELNIQ